MNAANPSLGLYLHVPFCRTRCRYCDFYRVGENQERMAGFLAALRREIDGSTEFHDRAVDTVFFGGGTPSLLTPDQVATALQWLRCAFRIAPDAEISFESNPSDLDPARLAAYRQAGLTRLSLGVQSFVDRELALLGRRHDGQRAIRCVAWAREAGFRDVSIDLMLGIPGQTRASLRQTVLQTIALAPDHVSAYLLEVHSGSEIDGLRDRRPRLFPGTESQRRAYLFLAEYLEAADFAQYEISNYCRPGHECRHNLKYWRRENYLGLGPAAHSCVDGRRWRRPADLGRYLVDPLAAEELETDPAAERLFLGLRLTEGLSRAELAAWLGLEVGELAGGLAFLAPFVEVEPARVRLTREGFLVSNAILARLLAQREARAHASH